MGELGFGNGLEEGNDVLHVFDPWVGFDFQCVVLHHEFKVWYMLMVLSAALEAMLPCGWCRKWVLNFPGSGVWVVIDQAVILGLLMGVCGVGSVLKVKTLGGFKFIFWGPVMESILVVCTWG